VSNNLYARATSAFRPTPMSRRFQFSLRSPFWLAAVVGVLLTLCHWYWTVVVVPTMFLGNAGN